MHSEGRSVMSTIRYAIAILALFLTPLAYSQEDMQAQTAARLTVSAKGRIKVAFVVTDGAVMIDFAGPWEVFRDVKISSRGTSRHDTHVFDMYTVSDTREPIHESAGMKILPDYTFKDAPQPNIVVVPAQSGYSPEMMEWLRQMSKNSDIVMSVCTGAFQLGKAGLLDGKKATTYHDSLETFRQQFPKVTVETNRRYVQSDPVIFTAGGLTSGIDLALHIVELYFGRGIAENTARTMEYEGTGWKGDGSVGIQTNEESSRVK